MKMKICGFLVKYPAETKHISLDLLVPLPRQVAKVCFGHYAGILVCKIYVASQAGIFTIVSLNQLKLFQ